jgi:hypothetical protein
MIEEDQWVKAGGAGVLRCASSRVWGDYVSFLAHPRWRREAKVLMAT